MSLIYKKGDILTANENLICHQVNVDGVMGGGLAKQIASAYPEVFRYYKKFCMLYKFDYETLKGLYFDLDIRNSRSIVNCFTQKPNFDTDYEAIEECFKKLLELCKTHNYSISVPYKYGCGIANGDWNIVSKIFEDLSNEYGVNIVVYQLEE